MPAVWFRRSADLEEGRETLLAAIAESFKSKPRWYSSNRREEADPTLSPTKASELIGPDIAVECYTGTAVHRPLPKNTEMQLRLYTVEGVTIGFVALGMTPLFQLGRGEQEYFKHLSGRLSECYEYFELIPRPTYLLL